MSAGPESRRTGGRYPAGRNLPSWLPGAACWRFLFNLLALLFLTANGAAAAEGDSALWRLSEVEDLRAIGEASRRTNAPIVLLVSQSDCPYCEKLKDEILHPLILSGEATGRVILRELTMDDEGVLPDFDGRERSRHEVAYRYKAYVSPTLLFLDGTGGELRKRIVGFQTPEFFGFYLDEAIADASEKFRARAD